MRAVLDMDTPARLLRRMIAALRGRDARRTSVPDMELDMQADRDADDPQGGHAFGRTPNGGDTRPMLYFVESFAADDARG